MLSLAAVAPAETFYRWHDAAGRLHFSNRSEQLPSYAQEVKLPELSFVTVSSSFAESPTARIDRSSPAASRQPECDDADPSPLIDAITSRLKAMPNANRSSELTLFVAGTPVWYSPNAVVQVLAASDIDGTSASEQAAVAYPASGACPRTPPLERYAATSRVRTSSGLCADYRRASEEIDIALNRNQNVARTFQVAAARYDSLTAGRGTRAGAQQITLPPWVVEAAAGQNAELANEVDDLVEELTVAREEIDRAAGAHGCW